MEDTNLSAGLMSLLDCAYSAQSPEHGDPSEREINGHALVLHTTRTPDFSERLLLPLTQRPLTLLCGDHLTEGMLVSLLNTYTSLLHGYFGEILKLLARMYRVCY